MKNFAAFIFLLTGCAATPLSAPSSEPAVSEVKPPLKALWAGRGSAAGRAGIRACLDRERAAGDPAACRSSPSSERVGNWAIIDDWENEMNVTLAWLRANGPTNDVDASQRAWEASMLADVSVYMNMYEGGTMAGLVGSIARAEAVVDRVIFLEKLRRQIGDA